MGFLERREEIERQYNEARREQSEYTADLNRYSSFDKIVFLRVLSEIVSEIEGVSFGYLTFLDDYEAAVIYSTDVYHRDSFIGSIELFKVLRKVILIKVESSIDDFIRFYELNYEDVKFKSIPNFKGFPYLDEFLSEVINYRFDNELKEISEEELNRLKNQFLLRKLGEKRDALINQIDGVSKKLISSDSDNK